MKERRVSVKTYYTGTVPYRPNRHADCTQGQTKTGKPNQTNQDWDNLCGISPVTHAKYNGGHCTVSENVIRCAAVKTYS